MSLQTNPPPYEYVAYIDESGDPGLRTVKPIDPSGSSEWLVLGAVVIRRQNEATTTQWITDITKGFRNHQRYGIHFKDLNPTKKMLVCQRMAHLDCRYFCVASNKKNMRGYRNPWAEQIPSDNWFYCWLTRLLLERITDFVEQKSLSEFGTPKLLKIIYSERGGLSYGQMNAYYTWLRMRSFGGRLYLPLGDLAWSVMHEQLLEVHGHNERAGLHLADAVASSFFKACDYLDTGACDPSFAKELKPRMARVPDKVDGQISGYGLKLMPNLKRARLTVEQEEIFRFYGYPAQWWAPVPSTPRGL